MVAINENLKFRIKKLEIVDNPRRAYFKEDLETAKNAYRKECLKELITMGFFGYS